MTNNIKQTIQEALASRILVVDGAMGTSIQSLDLTADDFGGPDYEGCNEYLSLTNPNAISLIHEDYLKAGADIIETNTFGATSVVLAEYELQHLTKELNLTSAKLAREMADKYSTIGSVDMPFVIADHPIIIPQLKVNPKKS